MTKNVVGGDTVLVTPVEDVEHHPPAIKLLEDMAKSTELPVASPVLTALGQQNSRPKRKSQINSQESKAKVQTKTVNGECSKPADDVAPDENGSKNVREKEAHDSRITDVDPTLRTELPANETRTDKVQKNPTLPIQSVQKVTRSSVQHSKIKNSLQILLVDKNNKSNDSSSRVVHNDTKCKNNKIENDEKLIKNNIENMKDSDAKSPTETDGNREVSGKDSVCGQTKNREGVFLIRPQHYVKAIDGEQVWCCDICTVVCSQLPLFRKHYLRLHISPKFISEHDKETWNIIDDISNKDVKLFKCHVCKDHFGNKNDLKMHLTHHPEDADSKCESRAAKPSHKPYVCTKCDAVFRYRKKFGKHNKICLNPTKPSHHCLYCNETFFTPTKKKNHILSNHPYSRRKHPCVFCTKVFQSNIVLFNHLVGQHSSSFFGCSTCKERFINSAELKAHHKKAHPSENIKVKCNGPEGKEFFQCPKCNRVFLVENCLNKHECVRQNVEKDRVRQKRTKALLIERKIERRPTGETDFYSKVSTNIRDNLTYHIDGKLHPVDRPDDAPHAHRTILHFNAGVQPAGVQPAPVPKRPPDGLAKSPNTPTYEKFNFPKEYDGRCGLTSFIKDASYLDISTQLIMRKNLQRLNLLSEIAPDPRWDVPGVLALERLGAQCAESFGTSDPPRGNDTLL